MAKKRKTKKTKSYTQRDINTITKSVKLLRVPVYKKVKKEPLKLQDDLRRYKPKTDDHFHKIDGRRVTYKETFKKEVRGRLKGRLYAAISFADPRRVLICERRRRRRTTLFRRSKIGKGISVSKIRLRTIASGIVCRRR